MNDLLAKRKSEIASIEKNESRNDYDQSERERGAHALRDPVRSCDAHGAHHSDEGINAKATITNWTTTN